jgi:hypothetical protein
MGWVGMKSKGGDNHRKWCRTKVYSSPTESQMSQYCWRDAHALLTLGRGSGRAVVDPQSTHQPSFDLLHLLQGVHLIAPLPHTNPPGTLTNAHTIRPRAPTLTPTPIP